MRKIILIALALIAAALVAVALQVRNSDRVTDLQSQPLLDEAKLSQLAAVEQIELARAGQQVVLQRDGEAWTVTKTVMMAPSGLSEIRTSLAEPSP